MSAPWEGGKCWYHSSNLGQGEEETVELDDTPEEHPHWRQKEGRPVVKPLKESHQEAFSRESEVIKAAKQAYYKTHHPSFE